jgi:acyl-CoA synthetase (AMP-forming)/AMP-acid ligase II
VEARPGTLVGAVLAAAAERPEQVALHGPGPEGVTTWADLVARVHRAAAEYAGARRLVLLVPGNDVDSVVEYLAALLADQVVLLAAGPAVAGLVEAWDPDVVADPATGRRTFCRTTSLGAADPTASAHDLHPELSLLLSTSGSTGSPKLVRLSHAAVLANAEAIADALGIRADDVAATTLPLHYCYGLSVLHSHLVRGAAVSLTDASVLDDGFWEQARRGGVTTFPGVPHTFELLARRGFSREDLPSLRYLTQAGGRMVPARVRELAAQGAREGFDLVVMYGATEATARMAVLAPASTAAAPGSIGRPLAGASFELAPVEGAEPGVGELVFHGPNVMLGYATAPGDLALGRTTHELRTGDLARRRGDGLWEVVGRRSRIAKVFGLRVDLDRAERELARRDVVGARSVRIRWSERCLLSSDRRRQQGRMSA